MKDNCYKCDTILTSDNRVGGKNPNLCKQCFKEYRHEHYLKHKDRYNKSGINRHYERMATDPKYKTNRNAKNRENRKNNPNAAKEQREYRSKNAGRINKLTSIRRKLPHNKVKRNAECRTRQANKLNATPAWANQGYIRIFYEGAKIEEGRTGQKVHVDHIVPLNHKLVCGLHCEDNLQLLFAKENQLKSNTFN